MTPEQALSLLWQAIFSKPIPTPTDVSNILQAWSVLGQMIEKAKEVPKEQT